PGFAVAQCLTVGLAEHTSLRTTRCGVASIDCPSTKIAMDGLVSVASSTHPRISNVGPITVVTVTGASRKPNGGLNGVAVDLAELPHPDNKSVDNTKYSKLDRGDTSPLVLQESCFIVLHE